MSDSHLRAVSIDLTALEAVVRALTRVQARRSPTALCDLLQALSMEADRLREAAVLEDDIERSASGGVLDAWIAGIREEAIGV